MELVTKASELNIISRTLEMGLTAEIAVIRIGYGKRGLSHTVRICASRLTEYLQMLDGSGSPMFPEASNEIEKHGIEEADVSNENLISVLCGFELIKPTQAESWGTFFDVDAAEIQQINKEMEDEARADSDQCRTEGDY